MTVYLNTDYGANFALPVAIPAIPGVILKGQPMGLLMLITYAVDGG